MITESGAERRFQQYLRERALKFTQERRAILHEVFNVHAHFEAEDIVLRLRDRGERVSRASVYRTLPLLVHSGLLREVPSNEKHSHYEHIFGHEHHDHMVCVRCGRIIEFHYPQMERMQEEVCLRAGFRAFFHNLEIHGLCEECVSAN